MWGLDTIHIEIELAEHPVMIVNITTPAGRISLLGSVSIVGQVLHIDKAHVDGLRPGKLGRAGLNAIGRKLLDVANVEEIIIQGATRSTGRYKGKIPRPIRFRRSQDDADP
jgi:hypothetical protein